MMLWWLVAALFLLFAWNCFLRWYMKVLKEKPDVTGKTLVITGGTDGIGKWTLTQLFERNPRILLFIGRDTSKAKSVVAECLYIAEERLKASREPADIVNWTRIFGNLKKGVWSGDHCFESSSLIFKQCDLGDLDEVDSLADYVSLKLEKIDLLINNAGGLHYSRQLTKQNIEVTIANNFLGHFWLINRLLPKLKASKHSRIINLSSCMHKFSLPWPKAITLDFKDMFLDKTPRYDFWYQYGLSKLAVNLGTKGLDRWMKVNDVEGIKVVSVFPGIVLTSLNRGLPPLGYKFTEGLRFLARFVGNSLNQAGQSLLYVSSIRESELEGGSYYFNCEKASENPFLDNHENIKTFWNQTLTLLKTKRPESAFNLTSL